MTNLFNLATRTPHKFKLGTSVHVPAARSISGHDQTECVCQACRVVRVNVILTHGGTERLWRLPGETCQRVEEPVCQPVEVEAK